MRNFELRKNMKQSVMIKGNTYGITVVLDPELPFSRLKEDVASKFQESSGFFKNARMALAFEGKKLSSAEQMEMVSAITDNSSIQVLCVVDPDKEREEIFRSKTEQVQSVDYTPGLIYKGTLRGGQAVEAESNIVILGDVNPGGKVIAKGNIIVLGALKGNAYAGISGNEHAFVAALEMDAMQIRIGDAIARCEDDRDEDETPVPKIAFVEDGNIYVETICKEVLNDIKLI